MNQTNTIRLPSVNFENSTNTRNSPFRAEIKIPQKVYEIYLPKPETTLETPRNQLRKKHIQQSHPDSIDFEFNQ